MPERQTHDYIRAGTTTLFAALDVASGKVISAQHRRHRAVEFRRFLNLIDRETPAGMDVHLIVDNYGTHKAPIIKDWLLAHPRFQLHFIPTYSSWMNLVERFFAEITRRMIRRGTYTSVKELKLALQAWTDDWNAQLGSFQQAGYVDETLFSDRDRLRRPRLRRAVPVLAQTRPRHRAIPARP